MNLKKKNENCGLITMKKELSLSLLNQRWFEQKKKILKNGK